MKVTGSGVGPKELALIKKTLKANPGCSVVVNRGPDGQRKVRLRHRTDSAARFARLKARARRADLLLLQARVQDPELFGFLNPRLQRGKGLPQ